MMARKLALLLALCFGSTWQAAWALGVGEIRVGSALNRPFEATIELRSIGPLEGSEVIVSLASAEHFERLGVERFFFLSDLVFVTDLSDPDRPVIRVTSRRPVTEPFVNFVIEVLWPSGRLLKEYTVLLDPPTYAARPLRIPAAPAVEPVAEPVVPVVIEPPADLLEHTGKLTDDTYGVTGRNDTLWEIALKVRPDRSHSVQQTMLALLRGNPEAFIGGNINQLKAGYVLRVPESNEIRRLSRTDAVTQVAEQNDRWRSGLDRAPLDARQTARAPSRPGGTQGELRLISDVEDISATGARRSGAALGTGAVLDEPVEEVGGDDDYRSLESNQPQAVPPPQVDISPDSGTSSFGAGQSGGSPAADDSRRIDLQNEHFARLQSGVEQQSEVSPATPSVTPSVTPSATPPAAVAPAPTTSVTEPLNRVSESAPAAASGLFGFSWLMLGSMVGGLLLVVIGGWLVLRRLSGSAADGDDSDFDDDQVERDIHETQIMSALSSQDFASAGEDVLAEADIHMAYGNFSQAAHALSEALEFESDRVDVRLKLLEVFVEQGNVDAFNEQVLVLREIADEDTIAEADRLGARLPGATSSMGEVTSGDALAPSREPGDGGVSLDFDLAGADEQAGGGDSSDIEGLGLDLELPGESGGSGESDGEGLDFALDLDGDDNADGGGDDGEGLDFALDLDGDDNADGGGDDEGLDFALDLDGDDNAEGGGDDEGLDFALDLDGDDNADGGGDDEGLDFALDLDGDDNADGGSDDEALTTGEDLDGDDMPTMVESASEEGALDDDESLDSDFEFDVDDLTDAGGDEGALDSDLGDDFGDDAGDAGSDHLDGALELARAYLDNGHEEGAREILDELVRDGNASQREEATELLARI